MTDIDRIRNYLLERINNGTFANYDNIAIFDELFLYETDDVIYVKRDLSMRYYLIAGEASGDLHASNLMRGLLSCDSGAEFRFYGGDKMESVGGTLVKH
jgi:hypothetical protein